jgi:hypothetical protein
MAELGGIPVGTAVTENAEGAQKLRKAAAIRRDRRNRFGSNSEGEPKLTRDGPGATHGQLSTRKTPGRHVILNNGTNREGESSKQCDDTFGMTLKGRQTPREEEKALETAPINPERDRSRGDAGLTLNREALESTTNRRRFKPGLKTFFEFGASSASRNACRC